MICNRLLLALALTAAASFASTATVVFTNLPPVLMTNTYQTGTGATYDGYTTATVNGVSGQYLICDDSVDTTRVPSSQLVFDFSTLGNDLSNISASPLRFKSETNAVTRYDDAAMLLYDFAQLGTAATNPTTTAQKDTVVDYQYVLWSLFNTHVAGQSDFTLNATQTALLQHIQNQVSDPNNTALLTSILSNVEVYSPDCRLSSAGNQEFLQYTGSGTPEPASFVLMGVGLLLGSLSLKRFRRS